MRRRGHRTGRAERRHSGFSRSYQPFSAGDLGVFRFLFLVFVGKRKVESIPTDRYFEGSLSFRRASELALARKYAYDSSCLKPNQNRK
jgi:hypothetical protein